MDEREKFLNDKRLYESMPDEDRVEALRCAGCKCHQPLLGWRPLKGPRCRLCNTEADIYKKE
jgi:hypothetical protein